jgi:hypothetical protein
MLCELSTGNILPLPYELYNFTLSFNTRKLYEQGFLLLQITKWGGIGPDSLLPEHDL